MLWEFLVPWLIRCRATLLLESDTGIYRSPSLSQSLPDPHDITNLAPFSQLPESESFPPGVAATNAVLAGGLPALVLIVAAPGAPTPGEHNWHHGNPQPSVLGVMTHILWASDLYFSWFWGPKASSIKILLKQTLNWSIQKTSSLPRLPCSIQAVHGIVGKQGYCRSTSVELRVSYPRLLVNVYTWINLTYNLTILKAL